MKAVHAHVSRYLGTMDAQAEAVHSEVGTTAPTARPLKQPRYRAPNAYVTNLMSTSLLVSVVDDDESVRESLPDLLRLFGYRAEAFASAEEFLASGAVNHTRCLILDIAMPGMSGPELQRELAHRDKPPPIVFITAHIDEAVRSRALEAGAVECLFKPFGDDALLSAVRTALQVR